MESRLKDVLQNKYENHILPFFWQHGESRELLLEGMEKIHESGIGAVCVESRPHPDFLGEKWWQDMDVIMEHAKKLNMRVWVLDDAHFPSGYCNGRIDENSPYGKTCLTHYTIDAVGPLKGNSFMIRLEPGERLISVLLSKRYRQDTYRQTYVKEIVSTTMEEALISTETAPVKEVTKADGAVFIDIPEGIWAVNVIKTTKKGTGRKGYINPIDERAVKFFIDTVYEPHYAHYGSEFGKTFAGFFSDEPEIGNCVGEYGHNSYIGQPDMNLPWSEALEKQLREKWGEAFGANLLSLWVCTDEDKSVLNRTGLLRREFMELVSEAYGKCFCGQIGDWCRAHGAEYIGHVIEDGGTHSHLGLGTGHYFKALWGQDMAGIDVVLQQIRPQLDDCAFYNISGRKFYHGEFYHYGLAKMGVSLGHLDSKKHGRTMCEIFGAYGWSEGLKLMKWLLDHMLVNGVNWFVPHAFTMKDFPDPDCPPHFYARGNNPQYPFFRLFMEYANRVSHLISGGRHVPAAALLYTAEQEWMGDVRNFEKDAKELTRGQIDFEVVPEDLLLCANVENGKLFLGDEGVRALVVPGSGCIGRKLAEKCGKLAKQGIEIFFTEKIPKVLNEDGGLSELNEIGGFSDSCPLPVEPEKLAETLRKKGVFEIQTSKYEPWLRYYHYVHDEGEFWLFFTESVTEQIETELTFTCHDGIAWWYDPWINKLSPCEGDYTAHGKVPLHLSPYEMKILYVDLSEKIDLEEEQKSVLKEKSDKADYDTEIIEIPESAWKLETACVTGEDSQMTDFSAVYSFMEGMEKAEESCGSVLGNLTSDVRKPYFSGLMKYSVSFELNTFNEDSDAYNAKLDLGEVYESVKLLVNGKEAGVRVVPPYVFDVTGLLKCGKNEVEVLVANTLVHKLRDFMSMTMPIEPSGLIGPVKLEISHSAE